MENFFLEYGDLQNHNYFNNVFNFLPEQEGPKDEIEGDSILNEQDRQEPTLDDDDTQTIKEGWNTDRDGIDKVPINPEDAPADEESDQ